MTIHYLFSIRDLGGEHKEETIRADLNPCTFSRELDGQSLIGGGTSNSNITSDLKLRSQERARQIKRAREEFLSLSGASDLKINSTTSVGYLPLKKENSYWKRKFEKTKNKPISNNAASKDNQKNESVQNKYTTGNVEYENDQTEITSYGTQFNENHSANDTTFLSKSYSCPSSPRL